jgi:CO/xanthine dehydrogenase Mo-binding subunit
MTHYRGATSLGCAVGGVGQAILEETVTDAVTGRIPNGTFGDYPVAVNADVPEIDVVFVG